MARVQAERASGCSAGNISSATTFRSPKVPEPVVSGVLTGVTSAPSNSRQSDFPTGTKPSIHGLVVTALTGPSAGSG